ncbi:MAG: hypothetical protein KDA92_18200 [Planctomycetales bacterium]|nr:hypothetical protein [Planctomycetales bacterium]
MHAWIRRIYVTTRAFTLTLKLSAILLALLTAHTAVAQLMLSGNENKIELTSGTPQAASNPQPDSLSLIDFSTFPPQVRHTPGISNTVIGPPSNLAILSGGRRALLADSLVMDSSATPDPWRPGTSMKWLDLTSNPIRVITSFDAGKQPSGLSVDAAEKFAIVANRAAGSLSLIELAGDTPRTVQTLDVCAPELSISDVAIHPNGKLALASVQKGGYLAIVNVSDGKLTLSDHKVSVYGQPYRVVTTPDGALGLTAGQGFAQNGIDADALSIVDLQSTPARTIGYVSIGAVPESIEISPDGQWVAAVLMAGSNYPPTDSRHAEKGELAILRRNGKSFEHAQTLPTGRIPEGVAFTSDGRYLVVQAHPERQLWVYELQDGTWVDTTVRISVPGMPSSLRASR